MSVRDENEFEVQDQCYHNPILKSKLVRSPMPTAVNAQQGKYRSPRASSWLLYALPLNSL